MQIVKLLFWCVCIAIATPLHATNETAAPNAPFTSLFLFKEKLTNWKSFNDRFMGKVIHVQGRVSTITPMGNSSVVYLDALSEETKRKGFVKTAISCKVSDPTNISKTNSLQEGETVTLRGRVEAGSYSAIGLGECLIR